VAKRNYKFLVLNILGVFFLILGIGAIVNSLYLRNLTQIFWMCYISLILIGVGILKKNSFLIISQINILAIPFIFWDIDFIYWLVFNQPLWGITDYFFLERTFTIGKVISLQHLFTVPIALYATHLIGLKRKDTWKFSMVQAVLVYIAVTIFTSPETNINCVFDPCINIYFGLPYRLTWFLIFFIMIIITTNVVNRLKFLRKDKNDRKTEKKT